MAVGRWVFGELGGELGGDDCGCLGDLLGC